MDIKLLAIINLNYLVTYIAYSIFPPYFPKIAQEEKGIDQQYIGLIMSFWYVGYAIVSLLMAHILMITGRKNAIVLGFIMLTAWFMLASLWSKLESKILFASVYWGIRLLHGIAQAFIQVTTYSIVGTWFRENIIKVVGFIQFSWGWGIAFGPIFAEILYNKGGFNLPLFICAGLMTLFSLISFIFMPKEVEGGESHENDAIQATDSSLNDGVAEESLSTEVKKIPIFSLLKYKLFTFGIVASFLNLTFYTILEPILSKRLLELNANKKHLGEYFFIQPFVYSIISIFLVNMILKKISKRVLIIIGFVIFGIAFLFIGPSRVFFFAEPSVLLVWIGLALIGVAASLSFIPIFPELIESVMDDFKDRMEDLNNTASSLMNASYGSAALGQL